MSIYNTLAFKNYDNLCTAYGRTTQNNNVFGDYIKNLVANNIVSVEFVTNDEKSYIFADGSTLDIFQCGQNGHMTIKGEITTGIVSGADYDLLEIKCNYN